MSPMIFTFDITHIELRSRIAEEIKRMRIEIYA